MFIHQKRVNESDRSFSDLIVGIGSRRWNWKFREKHFLNPKPELLLHSRYSFWLKTLFTFFTFFRGSVLDKSQSLPQVDSSGQKLYLECNRSSGFGFQKCFSRNFQLHRRDPIKKLVFRFKISHFGLQILKCQKQNW